MLHEQDAGHLLSVSVAVCLSAERQFMRLLVSVKCMNEVWYGPCVWHMLSVVREKDCASVCVCMCV